MNRLNDYVIGQKEVKVALSVGVYNHYKRIYLAESQQAMQELRKAEAEESGYAPPPPSSTSSHGPTLQEMNLGQFGTRPVKDASEKLYCEAPDASSLNSIRDSSFARDVEDCEIDKSNILLLGPTGSGKVCCGLCCGYDFDTRAQCLTIIDCSLLPCRHYSSRHWLESLTFLLLLRMQPAWYVDATDALSVRDVQTSASSHLLFFRRPKQATLVKMSKASSLNSI